MVGHNPPTRLLRGLPSGGGTMCIIMYFSACYILYFRISYAIREVPSVNVLIASLEACFYIEYALK